MAKNLEEILYVHLSNIVCIIRQVPNNLKFVDILLRHELNKFLALVGSERIFKVFFVREIWNENLFEGNLGEEIIDFLFKNGKRFVG